VNSWRGRLLVVAAVLVVACIAAAVFAEPLVRAAVAGAGRAAGYTVGYGRLSVGGGRLSIEHPDVASLAAEPVFSAERIDVAYDLGAFFRGPNPYGISSVEIDRPKITLIHHKDGSYNIRIPAANPNATPAPFTLPTVRVVVRNGSFGLLDDTRIFEHSRRIAIEDVQVDADLRGPSGRSTFTLAMAVLESGGKFPVTGRGTLDEARGYEMTKIHAKTLALAPLFDYAVNSTTLHAANGVLNDLDARVYGLLDRSGTMARHISVTADIDHFQPYLNGLAKPLRDGRGVLRVYDRGLTLPKIDGSIAGVPVRITGGIYDLSNPTVRLGIVGQGDLHDLITLSNAAKNFPLAGPLAFRLLVEGDATLPTTLAAFTSPRIVYANIPLETANGLVALSGQDTTILRGAVRYDGIRIAGRGAVTLGAHTGVDMLANVVAPAQRVPYAAQLLGPMLVNGTAVVSGVDANLLTTAAIVGNTPDERLVGTLQVDGRGVGTIGPIALTGPGRRDVFLRVALDRPHGGGGAAFVSARAFRFSTAGTQPSLPGLPVARIPAADGTLDGDIAGTLAGKRYAFGGKLHLFSAHALGFPIDDVIAHGSVSDGQRVALVARYRGALAPLARAAGGKVAASGTVDIPVSIVAAGQANGYAQISGARFDRARVAGLAITALDATIGIRKSAIDVYAAQARIDGNDVVASGSFGDGGTLAVSTSGIELADLRAAGLPVRAGRLAALASVGGTESAPTVAGDVVASDVTLENAAAADIPIDATTGLTFHGDTLGLNDTLVQAGTAVASLDGSVSGIRSNPQAARYAFDARVRQADIGTLARLTKAPLSYPEGTLNADVHVTGIGSSPNLAGRVALPEGSINGLRFRNGSVAFGGTPQDLSARGGTVTVGTSVIGFSAAISPSAQSFALHAPRVDLTDLNDYFDQGDTLGGKGSIAASVDHRANALATSGRVRLTHTRFRRFDLGDTTADWSTGGRTIATAFALGTTAGRVSAHGDFVLPASEPLHDTFVRGVLSLDARAESVDLATWLPAAGIVSPVTGLVDGSAEIHGSYPNVTLHAHAGLTHGMVQRVAIRTATIDVTAARGTVTIASGVFAIDHASARLSGTAGLGRQTPLDLALVAETDDAGALATTLTGKTFDAAGAVTTTLHLTGKKGDPTLAARLEATSIRVGRLTIPHAHADAEVTRERATLKTAELDLTAGRLLAAGYAPVSVTPSIGIAERSPLSLAFTADHAELGQFAALLPKGTTATGVLNGTVTLVGSLAVPGLRGQLDLSNGSFEGPDLTSKVTSGVAELVFADRTMKIQNTSVAIGGGTLTATGQVSVRDLQDPAASAAANLTIVSNGAVLDAPKYLKGRVNGTVTIVRAPGSQAVVGGNLTFTSTRIPVAALLPSSAASAAPTQAAIPVAFDLGVDAGTDVRVQGGPVDIGAQGHVHVGGTLAKPALDGQLDSTGGTISFYRTFRLQYPSTVRFHPSDGVIPDVDAIATTTVDNPQTDVTIVVTGPATMLNVALSSDPNYSREQILGLLVGAQALGAVSGLQPTTAGGAQQNPFQALAEGQLGTLLTQNLLEPFSSQLGSAVGLNNLAINYTPGGGVDIGAQKKIFKNVTAVFAQSFTYPPRQSIGLRASPNDATAIQLTFFSQPASNRYNTFEGANNVLSTNASVTSVQPANGSNGFSLSFQRRFR
jgi:autotransporter translocation and assembly factor TamB